MGSKFYVYRFINDNWNVPFYVGKGSNGRYKTLHNRSEHIKSICSNYNWHTEIIKYFDSETKAYEYENLLKNEYKSKGYPIIDGESNMIRHSNQRLGIEKAKEQGKYKGKQPIKVDEKAFRSVCMRWRKNEITATQAMKELNLKPNTFYRRVKEFHI